MTRINLVDPTELMDQHLVAEYRELFMVGSSLQRSLKSPNWNIKNIPATFTLNKGHVSFFYNKGKYLFLRYNSLIREMKARGMNPNPDRTFEHHKWPSYLYKDWTATEADKDIVRERIKERIAAKPNWYRKTANV
jgi:deoxyribonuclease (pyrimidine dimer)